MRVGGAPGLARQLSAESEDVFAALAADVHVLDKAAALSIMAERVGSPAIAALSRAAGADVDGALPAHVAAALAKLQDKDAELAAVGAEVDALRAKVEDAATAGVAVGASAQ